jgi:hypothetical protein
MTTMIKRWFTPIMCALRSADHHHNSCQVSSIRSCLYNMLHRSVQSIYFAQHQMIVFFTRILQLHEINTSSINPMVVFARDPPPVCHQIHRILPLCYTHTLVFSYNIRIRYWCSSSIAECIFE